MDQDSTSRSGGDGLVLVVDDEPGSRRLLQIYLNEAGFEVVTASSGQECLDLVEERLFDVILMDIRMPGMSGNEACRRLKLIPEVAEVPVLFVTGHGDEQTAVVALESGGNDVVSKDSPIPILIARVRSQVAISRKTRELRQTAMSDDLTGLANRRMLFFWLRQALKVTSRFEGGGMGCLLMDVDHFKAINDAQGHIAGDEVLFQVAEALKTSIRETDFLCRYGGDEFVIILPNTPAAGTEVVGEKARSAVEATGRATISVGATWIAPMEITDLRHRRSLDERIQSVLRRADFALYAAKKAGRNVVSIGHVTN